jgi:hypothetical protein
MATPMMRVVGRGTWSDAFLREIELAAHGWIDFHSEDDRGWSVCLVVLTAAYSKPRRERLMADVLALGVEAQWVTR